MTTITDREKPNSIEGIARALFPEIEISKRIRQTLHNSFCVSKPDFAIYMDDQIQLEGDIVPYPQEFI